MEVGAVKQAFNNEVILMKKNLNQAKIQTIHKLTRKAKTFNEKKCPDVIQEKYKRKAESAVDEVLIIKKIKPKDLAKFIVTHKGQLNDYLNKPNVDNDKACARLLLHKALISKYQLIRDRFTNVPIKDLLMSRVERRQQKKEAKEKLQNKKKKRNNSETDNTGGVWDIEDCNESKPQLCLNGQIVDHSDENKSDHDDELMSDDDIEQSSHNNIDSDKHTNNVKTDLEFLNSKYTNCSVEDDSEPGERDCVLDKVNTSKVKNNNKLKGNNIRISHTEHKDHTDSKEGRVHSEKDEDHPKLFFNNNNDKNILNSIKSNKNVNKHTEKKLKDNNKNKNLNEKLRKRNFNKDLDDKEKQKTQIVDSFFITSTGKNYMSLVEPRQPDEIKETHKEGNRKYRRAVMFGHIPKPRKSYNNRNHNYDTNKSYDKANDDFKGHINERQNNFKSKNKNIQNANDHRSEEKLHPSWEAKKRQATIIPFKGKKIMFDDN